MIAIFRPVTNWPWFDVREFEIIDWKPSTYKWLKVQDCYLENLPVFKPLNRCKNRLEYLKQFND